MMSQKTLTIFAVVAACSLLVSALPQQRLSAQKSSDDHDSASHSHTGLEAHSKHPHGRHAGHHASHEEHDQHRSEAEVDTESEADSEEGSKGKMSEAELQRRGFLNMLKKVGGAIVSKVKKVAASPKVQAMVSNIKKTVTQAAGKTLTTLEASAGKALNNAMNVAGKAVNKAVASAGQAVTKGAERLSSKVEATLEKGTNFLNEKAEQLSQTLGGNDAEADQQQEEQEQQGEAQDQEQQEQSEEQEQEQEQQERRSLADHHRQEHHSPAGRQVGHHKQAGRTLA